MFRKKAIAAAMLMGLAFALPAQAQSVLRVKGDGDIKQLDALFTTSYPTRDMAYLIFDTLFSVDANYKPQPQMVDKWSVSDDRKTYTFTLRPGLKFHDGAPVTSADVVASIDRWLQRDSMGMEIAKRRDSLTAVDASTFRLVLKEPFDRVIEGFGRMTAYPLFVMPARLAKTPPTEEIREFVGSGPFKLAASEWIPGVQLVLTKNADYVPRSEPPSALAGGKIAKVDRIERITFRDDMSAVNALLAGEIDYVSSVPPELLPVLQADPDIQWAKAPILGKNFQVIINHTQPPFNDVRMRQALQYLVNQQDMMTAIFGNRKDLYEICGALFMCGGPYATDIGSERFLNPSVDKAKELIKAAGYDGTPIVYLHPMDGKIQRDAGTILVAAMRKAGIVVEDVQMDTATMFTRRTNKGSPKEGGWNVFMTGFAGDALMDPLTNPFMTGACEKAWIGWPCDTEMQKLWQDFLLAGNDAQRREIAIKLQAKANEIVTYIPIGQYNDISAWRKNVSGMVPGPILTLWNVQKTR